MSGERADQRFHEPALVARAAFAELAGISLGDESTSAVLERVAELAKTTIPQVAEASVSLVRGDTATTAASTGRLALDLDESQYGRGYGPCLEAAASGEVLEITDARREARWPGYTAVAVELGSLSSLSVPLPIRPVVYGGLNLYGIEAEAFDDEARDAARVYASYAAVAVQNMNLHETTRDLAANLDAAMQSRALIEQAKEILMREHHCDAGVAFEILRSASQRYNRKLRDIAQGFVDGEGRGPKG